MLYDVLRFTGDGFCQVTTISLHKYHDQINQLLDDNQYSLAANHCRYILQQYPRHVDTYRLLARTMIEQGDYSGATELFLRVLSADPNDYIAHAGLSVVYREGDVLSQSIWHLERAYEIEPYNGAIQQELKNLYVDYSEQKGRKQKGEPKVEIPDSLPLTKGALARLYIQGEFYAQAIDILGEALAEDEDRIDLEVLLVEALWRDNQRKTAVQVCLQVLEKLPNCIIANAVLAEIWLQIGRIDEAQNYLKELQALTLMDSTHQDLESPAGSAFQPEGAFALPAVFAVERMGDDMNSLSDGEPMGTYTDDNAIVAEDGDDYQWLEGLGEEFDGGDVDSSPADTPLTVTDSDWLRRELVVSDEETAVSDDIASWLDETADEESDIDIFGAVAAGAVAAGVIGSQLKDEDDMEEDDTFDWFSEENLRDDISAEDEAIIAQVEHVDEVKEMPDWLADMAGDNLEPVQVDLAEASIFIVDIGETDYLSATEDVDENSYDWLDDAISDEPGKELEPGEIDLSQFAEFGEGEDRADDDGEIVWRLTDELNPLEETGSIEATESADEEEDELDELNGFDFKLPTDETGDLEDVPDWLVGSSGIDELDAASPTEAANIGIADELAEWVAANQPEIDDDDELPDWLSDEPSDVSTPKPLVAQTLDTEEEEDDFFTGDLPDWMSDSSSGIDDSAPLGSAALNLNELVDDDSAPLVEADLPDWLMGGSMLADDSGLLETGNLPEVSEAVNEAFAPLVEEDLLDWLAGDEEDEDGVSGTAVVSGLLGALAAGAFAKEHFKDEDEPDKNQPEQLIHGSNLEDEVTEDAVSDKQDDLIGPQDELEKPEPAPQESDEFDWLDDLDGTSLSAETNSMPLDDLDDGLDWMDLDSSGESDELNLDALLGLEREEQVVPVEDVEALPIQSGLAEDESLDWLDALAGGEPEAVDEMPTWQWSEEGEDDPTSVINDIDLAGAEPLGSAIEDIEGIFPDELGEADVVEDLDDAMSWLEDLAAEPDAPVEELPSVAEDMDLDALFAVDSELDFLDDLSDVSEQTETLDEIFAADSQNDSWLEGLSGGGKEPLPDFLEEDGDFDFDGLLDEELAGETAVSITNEETLEAVDDLGGPPEDIDDAMAWLEQLAARQGADLEELPSVNAKPEEDGMGIAEIAVGAAALGALGAVLTNDDDEERELEAEFIEDDLLAMEVPEDPDEAMAWLEKLAARQGAPLEELPSVSEYEEITQVPEAVVEDDWFGLDADESDLEDFFADADTLPALLEADDEDALTELDDAMAWLDGLGDEDSSTETTAEEVVEELDDLAVMDFGDEELDIFDFEEEEPPFAAVEEPAVSPSVDLSDELDWLESVTSSDKETAVYHAEDISLSDDDLSDALEKLTLLAVAGTAIGLVRTDEDELAEIVVEDVETAVTEPESTVAIAATDFIEEMPEDPDEAMAWLEKLAARQGARLDELPSVNAKEYDDLAAAGAASRAEAEAEALLLEEDELVDEILVDEWGVPEETTDVVSPEDMDVDDAMAWLEQLAARQGADLEELPSVDASDLDKDIVAPDWVVDAQEQEEALPVAIAVPIIEEILDEPYVEASVDLPDDMDMDDAMAWLEKLAARQGADLDELPSVSGTLAFDDDIETPDWIARQTGSLDDGILDALDMPDVYDESLETASDEDFFAALDEVPAIEGIETSVKGADNNQVPDLDDIDDSMPDWLSGGEENEDEVSLGHTGWLNTLDEPDMGSWLAAEAEATASSSTSDDTLPKAIDTDSLISTGGLEDTGSLGSQSKRGTGELRLPSNMTAGPIYTAELDEAQVLADLDLGDIGGGLDKAQLEAARSSLAGGDIDAALYDYQSLVDSGESMHTVITDLERAAELHQDKPLVRRLLGDAYMRNGQISKAIETYRNALDQM